MASTQNVPKNIQLVDVEQNQRPNENKVSPLTNNETQTIEGEKRERVILDKIDGICKSGELTAILGASGAGKTSLLNLLACRIEPNQNVRLEGKILSNNNQYDFLEFPNFATYVMQDDRMMETLTVRECLQFGADLKMKAPQEEKNKRVDSIIRMMRLDRAQNTLIGGQFVKGVSGGERKRASIGFEIMCEPQVILLDEPTSGLDSFTAFLLILTLSRYARRGKTVILTIHQPSADIWNLFDRIMLLVDGHFIYQGKGQADIINYFSNMGFTCPSNSNPADYILSIMHAESERNKKNYELYYKTYEKLTAQRVQNEIEMHRQNQIVKYTTQNSFSYEVSKIAARTVINLKRNPVLFSAKIGQTIILGLFVGAIYYNLPNGYNGTALNIQDQNNKTGYLFFVTILDFMSAMQPTVLTFPAERNVFLKEQNMKMYKLSSYFVGKTVPEIPVLMITPLISLLVMYWLVGLETANASYFWIQYFASAMLAFNGNSLGLLVGTAFSDAKTAMAMMPSLLLPFMLFSGFFANGGSYQDWIGWLQYLSPIKYGFEAYARNQYALTGFLPNPIVQLDFTVGLWLSIGLLIILAVVYRIFAFFYLWKNTKKLQ